jgi:hypothetical protein
LSSQDITVPSSVKFSNNDNPYSLRPWAFNLMHEFNFFKVIKFVDRLCGLVVRVLGYRSGGPGSIPGTTRKKKE